jgi:hypothetical protein
MLIDNITYENGSGGIENSANDGSASDILISAPHAATQEFNGVNPSDAVVYELDTPTVSDLVSGVTLTEKAAKPLTGLFSVSNPLASQAITEWQVYDTSSADAITLNGVAQTADHSAATAATVSSLSTVALQAGNACGADCIEVRAYNGAYWGDWQSLAATVTAPAPPVLTSQTANQTWTQGQKVSLVLPANTFTDPQGQALTTAASLANGQPLPSWLSYNAATRTFSGTVPKGMESLTLKVTATDTSGLSASESFGVTVPAAAPTLTSQTPNQTWSQGQKISLALPATVFTDPQGEALSYAAVQTNGKALPSWLSFNAATRTFSGTVPSGAETLSLKVTATDTSGLASAESFGVTVPAGASGAAAGINMASILGGTSAMRFFAPQAGSASTLIGFDDSNAFAPRGLAQQIPDVSSAMSASSTYGTVPEPTAFGMLLAPQPSQHQSLFPVLHHA